MDNFFTQKNCDRCGKSLKTVEFKVCLTANVSVWTARKRNVPIRNTKRHKMPTLRKFVRETITLREYEGSIYTNKGCTICYSNGIDKVLI